MLLQFGTFSVWEYRQPTVAWRSGQKRETLCFCCAERNNRQKDTHSTRLTMRTVEAEDRRDQRKKRGLEGLQHYSKTIFLQRNDHSFLTRQNKRWTWRSSKWNANRMTLIGMWSILCWVFWLLNSRNEIKTISEEVLQIRVWPWTTASNIT